MERAPFSSRVGRFGPRSLSFRVLLVVLVPMVTLQVLTWLDLRDQREQEEAAVLVRDQTDLVHDAANLIVPLATDLTVISGVVEAEALGSDRSVVAERGQQDFLALRDDAEAMLDDALDELSTDHGEFPLENGTVGEWVDTTRLALDSLHAAFSRHEGLTPAEVNGIRADLTAAVQDLTDQLGRSLRAVATGGDLMMIASETTLMVAVLGHGSDSLWYTTQAGVSGEPQQPLIDMVDSGGALEASLVRLGEIVDAQRATEIDLLMDDPSFEAVEVAQPQFIATVTTAAATEPGIVTSDTEINLVVQMVEASMGRLDTIQMYAHDFFDDEVVRADAARADAERAREIAAAIMIATLVVSLGLVVLLMRSILRPLGRLMRQARRVHRGELHLEPVRPSGPTDLRVVTRAFNEMVTSLQAYESQLDRLAQGDTHVDPSLPGPLGDTVRRSVGQLASVTAQLHASEAQANRQARTDALTGLANRTAALEQLAIIAMQARQNDLPGAVIFLDLDGFKSVNDTQGHAEGDRILAEIADRIRERSPGDVVARMGGDEFLVLIAEAPPLDVVTTRAAELIDAVAAPTTGTKGQIFTLSASAGISLIDGHRDPLACIAQADTAVYHAKERGRGRVEVYDERLASVIEERAEMALTMRQGLAEQQFFLCLQPIIDVATSQPVGAEVLLRWNRPGIGEIGPAEFIPIAEQTGVIVDLETWVLERAVAILREWRIDPATAQMRLAINVSGRHIIEGNLAPLLDELCRQANIDSSLIDLEITETHLMADVYRSIMVVDDLRAQGVNVAIDDFGTGYSSMSYLHRLTVDALKIDQVFIAGMADDRLDRTIVELLLRLGDSMGLTVVAEGVDSEKKLAMLREMGCHWAQGFHIARPMSIEDATRWLKQQQALASSMA